MPQGPAESQREQVKRTHGQWRAFANKANTFTSAATGAPDPVALREFVDWARTVRAALDHYLASERNEPRETEKQKTEWRNAVRAHLFFNILCEAVARAELRAALLNVDPTSFVWQAIQAAPSLMPIVVVGIMHSAPRPQQREAAALSLSGWAATNISLRKNRRLQKALRSLCAQLPSFQALLEQLPQAVWLAVQDWEPKQPLVKGRGSLINRTAREIEKQGQDTPRAVRARDSTKGPYEPPVTDRAHAARHTLEDVVLEAEAQQAERAQLHTLAKIAGCPPREAEVWVLSRLGYKQREIAKQLGMKIGTVGVLKSRADKRIERNRDQLGRALSRANRAA